MALRKYTKAEESDVLSPKEHEKVEKKLAKLGKVSMTNLTEEEREELIRSLAKSN